MAELPHATLITGGAGYIGSHTVLALRQAGRRVVVLDALSTGNRRVVPDDVAFVAGDAGDRDLVASLIAAQGVDSVIHFAGSILVEYSVSDPLRYYPNNVPVRPNLLYPVIHGGLAPFFLFSPSSL